MISKGHGRTFESAQTTTGATTVDGRASYDERLNHILAAATRVIARFGYEKASMRAVARESGVSLAGLYHYVEGKEKMLFLIQFRAFGALLSNLKEKLHGIDDPEEQLRVMVRAHISYFATNMEALKVCSHEMDSLSGSAYDETRHIRHEYYELTRAILSRLLDAHGTNGSLDRHVTTMALFGTLNWLYQWYDPQRGPAVTTVANQIANQLLYGILDAPIRAR